MFDLVMAASLENIQETNDIAINIGVEEYRSSDTI